MGKTPSILSYPIRLHFCFVFYLFFSVLYPINAYAQDYIQIAGLIDIRSTFSDGSYSIEELIKMSKDRGFDVVVFTDHDRMEMEYGLFPLRNIIRKRVEYSSVLKGGVRNYLDTIKDMARKYPDMILIPGVESAPFYYWTGSPFKRNLTAHNWEKHLLIVGLERAEDYENMPILSGGFSLKYVNYSLLMILLFVFSMVFACFLIRLRGFFKKVGVTLFILSLLLVINYCFFKKSLFDQYHGDRGILPYQALIDYVNERGGMTFWSHPESRSGMRKKGPIYVNTPPSPNDLIKATRYTGFAALYGDNITLTEPDKQWDTLLNEYCSGKRVKPVWAISTADYHSEKSGKLGEFPTVFLVKRKSKEEVLFALENGRMYACRGKVDRRLCLERFTVSDPLSPSQGTAGEEIFAKGSPVLRIIISSSNKKNFKIKGRIIRSGKLINEFSGVTPYDYTYFDNYFVPDKKIYYRIDVKGAGKLISNPIFVRFENES